MAEESSAKQELAQQDAPHYPALDAGRTAGTSADTPPMRNLTLKELQSYKKETLALSKENKQKDLPDLLRKHYSINVR
jgi:hypothetical protein